MVDPGSLHPRHAVRTDAFDGRDFGAFGRLGGHHAATLRLAVDVHGASAALCNAATEFRTGQPGLVSDAPEKRRVVLDVEVVGDSVDLELDGHRIPPEKSRP